MQRRNNALLRRNTPCDNVLTNCYDITTPYDNVLTTCYDVTTLCNNVLMLCCVVVGPCNDIITRGIKTFHPRP